MFIQNELKKKEKEKKKQVRVERSMLLIMKIYNGQKFRGSKKLLFPKISDT